MPIHILFLIVNSQTIKQQYNILKMKHIKPFINNFLSILFPYQDPSPNLHPFIEETWIEKNMQPPFLKDILWTPPFKG